MNPTVDDLVSFGDAENACGVEDARAGRQHDGGGFEGLHEQAGDLVGEQLRIGGGGFNHGNVLTMEVDSVPTSSGRLKGPPTGRDPFSLSRFS